MFIPFQLLSVHMGRLILRPSENDPIQVNRATKHSHTVFREENLV
jgi:hypothetical protein